MGREREGVWVNSEGVPLLDLERNAELGRELLALEVDVPWSAWEGYSLRSGFETGIVFEYQSQPPGRFIVRFSNDAETDDIG